MSGFVFQNGLVILKRCDRRCFRSYSTVRRLGSQALSSDLSKDDVDHILRRNERTVFIGEGKISELIGRLKLHFEIARIADAVHSFDSNQLPANSPCEDHYSYAKCNAIGSWFFGGNIFCASSFHLLALSYYSLRRPRRQSMFEISCTTSLRLQRHFLAALAPTKGTGPFFGSRTESARMVQQQLRGCRLEREVLEKPFGKFATFRWLLRGETRHDRECSNGIADGISGFGRRPDERIDACQGRRRS